MLDTKSIEQLFLKIFKLTVLVVMTVALIAIPILLLSSAYLYLSSPKQPVAVEKAVSQEISVESIKKMLIEQEKNKNAPQPEQGNDAPPAKKGALLYNEQALSLFRCGEDFKRQVGANVDNASDAEISQQVEWLRGNLERLAAKEGRGDLYVNSAVAFTCSVLKDPSIVALKKEGKIGPVVVPVLNVYTKTWKQIEDQNDQQAIAEGIRVAENKVVAVTLLVATAVLFATFMLLALYLIISRNEKHLQDINESIKAAAKRG